jgi:hypothetical protein
MLAVAVFIGLTTFASSSTPTYAAALNAMKGGDWASQGYNAAAKQKRMAHSKAAHQKKTK